MYMTCPPCFRYPNSFAKLAALALALGSMLSSCAAMSDFFYSPPPGKESEAPKKKVSGEFEWAVQNYEAGNYEKAIPQFRRLQSHGADVENFELVRFYLGMSYFQLKKDAEATQDLEGFLQLRTAHRQGQEARLALLAIYERAALWDKILGLAAETDALTLFQDNRAYLKLVWARALQEKNETKGARAVLKDASQYLDGQAAGKTNGPDRDRDLWGRYHYTSLMIDLKECNANEPKEIGAAKKKKRLYAPWMESTVDCFRRSVQLLSSDLLKPESAWAPFGLELLSKEIAALGQKTKGFLRQESGSLAFKRSVEILARQNYYRLLGTIDEQSKTLKIQGINEPYFDQIRKQVDLLLVSLSIPS